MVMPAVRSLARGARDELGDRRAGQQHEQPDADQLEPAAQASCQRQQAEHHETEAEVVRLGERVQSRQRIGEAQQPDGAGEEEERARRDAAIVTMSSAKLIRPPSVRGVRAEDGAVPS